MAQWNPPPPSSPPPFQDLSEGYSPEQPHTKDNIGDTVFSKSWVLSLLVMVVKAVQKDEVLTHDSKLEDASHKKLRGDESECLRSSKNTDDVMNAEDDGTCVKGDILLRKEEEEEKVEEQEKEEEETEEEEEINEDLENDLCRLWDVSVNHDVTLFLHEHHAMELLLGAACRSTMPRLSEICIGILGNMACVEVICAEGFGSSEQIQRVLNFLESTDSRILYETTRLIHTCLSHEKLRPIWLSGIEQSPNTYQALLLILQASANEDLLRSTAVLLDSLLDCSEKLLRQWTSKELVEAICEAAEQTRLSSFDVTCSFVMTLQLLSTVECGIPCLVQCGQQVSTLLCDVLLGLELMESSLSSLQATLTLLLTLCEASITSRNHICKNLRGQFLLKLLSDTSDSESAAVESSAIAMPTEAQIQPRPNTGTLQESSSSTTACVNPVDSNNQQETCVQGEDRTSQLPASPLVGQNDCYQSEGQAREEESISETKTPTSLHTLIEQLLQYISTE